MPDIVVTEYSEVAQGALGNIIPAGQEPSNAVQTVASGEASQPFQETTKIVMVTSVSNQRIKFGPSGTSASTSDTLILAGERFFGVQKGQVIANLDAV